MHFNARVVHIALLLIAGPLAHGAPVIERATGDGPTGMSTGNPLYLEPMLTSVQSP